MVGASPAKVVLGSIAFAIFWVLTVFPDVPLLPIGRTAGSLLGAMLMVLFRVISPEEAYAAIDLQILGLLFGTMVVSVYLERADMFKYLGKLLSWKSKGPRDLLCRICLISAILSAFFTNDTACLVLTEFVLKIARQQNLPPHPFLLALASSANIGSAATPIGNPQNLVIAVQSKISFGKFLFGLFPAMFIGVVVNTIILMAMYWRLLSSTQKDEEDATAELVADESARISNASTDALIGDGDSHKREESFPSKRVDFVNGFEILSPGQLTDGKEGLVAKWKRMLWKPSIYLVTVVMLVAFLMGLNMSWTAIAAALALVVLDFKDAGPSLEKVSYSLLIFFCGMFITVNGFNKTEFPSTLWDLMEPHAKMHNAAGTAVLALVILVLSNLASNVPTVLLLGGRVAASAAAISAADEKRAWFILAWVSTVAGNLSLLGSAANLIVCEQSRRAPSYGYNLSFWKHLKFGVPSTLVVTAVGLAFIR